MPVDLRSVMRSALRRARCRHRRWAGALVAIVSLLPGCELLMGADPVSSTGPCLLDTDCPNSELCELQMCRPTCRSSSDCSGGDVCALRGSRRVCLPPAEVVVADATSDSVAHEAAPSVGDDAPAHDATTDSAPAPDGSIDGPLDGDSAMDATVPTDSASGPEVDAGPDVVGDVDAAPDDAGPDVSPDGPGMRSPCPAPSRILLFGGANQNIGTLGDTWQWDGGTWTRMDSDAGNPDGGGPPARIASAMGGICGQAVMFGGDDGMGKFFDDLWTWDGGQWSQPVIVGSLPPASTGAAAGVANDNLVVFGGVTSNQAASSDTWIFSGQQWSLQPLFLSPTGRSQAAMAPFNGELMLLGGLDTNANPLSDAWLWNGHDSWISASAPPPHYGAVAAARGNTVVVFGGFNSSNAIVDDTWIWNGTTWTNPPLATRPGPRYSASMATLGDVVVLFGGSDLVGPLGDTWIWNGNVWTPAGQGGPVARQSATMASF